MKEPYAEGPNSYNGGNGPGGATKLPVKDYPASSKLPTGKETKLEGPCEGKEMYHK